MNRELAKNKAQSRDCSCVKGKDRDNNYNVVIDEIFDWHEKEVKNLTVSFNQLNKNISLSIKEVASKYGEELKCEFLDYDGNWKKESFTVNAWFIKEMEMGTIKKCY